MTYILVRKTEDEEKTTLRHFLLELLKEDITLEMIYSHPDIHNLEITEKLSIGIEDVKNFQKELIYKPFQESSQLGIIHDAQKLTQEAQNSLLKSLEESNEQTIYILTVDNEKNLLPTIRSRSRIVYTQTGNEQEEELSENFFDLDLIGQFAIVEKESEDRDSSFDFLNRVESTLKMEFELNIKNGNIDGSKKFLEDLKVVQRSREKIAANCNRRLTLEAMIIQLKS